MRFWGGCRKTRFVISSFSSRAARLRYSTFVRVLLCRTVTRRLIWKRNVQRRVWSKLSFERRFVRKRQRHFVLSVVWPLKCPGTLFISHENANFLFSVFWVVQSEAKTPKIMGCCRANFAFLHALKIGTFRGKWTLEMSDQNVTFHSPGSLFFNHQ